MILLEAANQAVEDERRKTSRSEEVLALNIKISLKAIDSHVVLLSKRNEILIKIEGFT